MEKQIIDALNQRGMTIEQIKDVIPKTTNEIKLSKKYKIFFDIENKKGEKMHTLPYKNKFYMKRSKGLNPLD